MPVEGLNNILAAFLLLLFRTGCCRIEIEDDVVYDEVVQVGGLEQTESQTISPRDALVPSLPQRSKRRRNLGQSAPKMLVCRMSLKVVIINVAQRIEVVAVANLNEQVGKRR